MQRTEHEITHSVHILDVVDDDIEVCLLRNDRIDNRFTNLFEEIRFETLRRK